MDYCARESTLEPMNEIRNGTIKTDVQETNKILADMDSILSDIEVFLNGSLGEDAARKDVKCLRDETRIMASVAYNCLQRIQRIKEIIF